MASYSVMRIEGIGPVYGQKLQGAGVRSTKTLLERAKDPKGRKALAAIIELDEGKVLKWANMADLMRIRGVGEEYSELLEAAGVDTVKELKMRNAANLHAAMLEINGERKLVRQMPSRQAVVAWIAQAKDLPPVLTY